MRTVFHRCARRSLWGLIVASVFSMTGCQMDIGGQTLPSPYYIYDDVQYFPSGPEFKLSREAAAMKAYAEDAPDESP